jgi:RING-box protein 1
MEIINPQPRFVIQKCSLVTQWAWDTINDCCPICRNSVNEDSITNENNPNMTSVVVVGMCGHAFHYECINRWLKNSKNCPLCNSNWEFQKTMDKNVINTQNDNELPTYSESGSQTSVPSVSINVSSTNLNNLPISPVQSNNVISEMIIDDDDDFTMNT